VILLCKSSKLKGPMLFCFISASIPSPSNLGIIWTWKWGWWCFSYKLFISKSNKLLCRIT